MNKEVIKIGGITCAACVNRIEKSVSKLDGIVDAKVNLATEKLTVNFDSKILSLEEIKTSVEEAGYEVIASKSNAVDEDN